MVLLIAVLFSPNVRVVHNLRRLVALDAGRLQDPVDCRSRTESIVVSLERNFTHGYLFVVHDDGLVWDLSAAGIIGVRRKWS